MTASYIPPPGHDARGVLIDDHRPRRKNKRTDKSGPKRASGAYVFFTNEMRPQILQEYPGIKFVELGKVLGERWRALTPDQKKKFEKMAAEDKVRFQLEMQQYCALKMEGATARPATQHPQIMGNGGYFHDQVTGTITYETFNPPVPSEHDVKQEDAFAVSSSQQYGQTP